jgi:hypothetical protein
MHIWRLRPLCQRLRARPLGENRTIGTSLEQATGEKKTAELARCGQTFSERVSEKYEPIVPYFLILGKAGFSPTRLLRHLGWFIWAAGLRSGTKKPA